MLAAAKGHQAPGQVGTPAGAGANLGDLDGAVDVSTMDGISAVTHALPKTLFLDVVHALKANGFDAAREIPSRIEGITFGPDIKKKGNTLHTLWMSNDNDFVLITNDAPPVANPNQFFVFGFTDADLGNSKFVPQFQESDDDNGDN